MSIKRTPIDKVYDEIKSIEDFDRVAAKLEGALTDAVVAIESAHDKDGFRIGYPIHFSKLAESALSSLDIYRVTLVKVFNGDCTLRPGMKVYAND